MKKTLYAAYGSNINIEQMSFRCPDANIFGKGKLTGYQLEFCRVANIVPESNTYAPVLLWEISEADEQKLDSFEGVPHKYHKEYLEVSVGNDRFKALVYVRNGKPSLEPPMQSYYDRIADGYVEAGFPIKLLELAEERAIAYLDSKYQTYGIFDKDYLENVKKHNSKMRSKIPPDKLVVEAFTLGQVFERYAIEDISDGEKLVIFKSVRKDFENSGYKVFEEFVTDYFEALLDADYSLTHEISEGKGKDFTRYAAYGSNMDEDAMKKRCPNSKLIGTATIPGFELKFNGCATIRKQEGASTPVFIWDIHQSDWAALDMYEGYPGYYRRETLFVDNGAAKEQAEVYIMNCDDKAYRRPLPSYYKTIETAYKKAGIEITPLEEALKKSAALEKKIERKR